MFRCYANTVKALMKCQAYFKITGCQLGLTDGACVGCRGEYRVVYVTPEFIEADGCQLLKQLHSKVGMLITKTLLMTMLCF